MHLAPAAPMPDGCQTRVTCRRFDRRRPLNPPAKPCDCGPRAQPGQASTPFVPARAARCRKHQLGHGRADRVWPGPSSETAISSGRGPVSSLKTPPLVQPVRPVPATVKISFRHGRKAGEHDLGNVLPGTVHRCLVADDPPEEVPIPEPDGGSSRPHPLDELLAGSAFEQCVGHPVDVTSAG